MSGVKQIEDSIGKPWIPATLVPYLQDLQGEDIRYSADEIVAAGEELLGFLSAVCILIYLYRGKQNIKNNQYVLELFLGYPSGNAGVVFSRALQLPAMTLTVILSPILSPRNSADARPPLLAGPDR